jgi:hypothetical protein
MKGGEGESRKRRRKDKKCERREIGSGEIEVSKKGFKGCEFNSRPLGFSLANMWDQGLKGADSGHTL